MGSYSLLQIIGSTVIGGLLLLMIFKYNTSVNEKKHSFETQNTLRSNLNTITKLFDSEFNKIGYCIDKNNAKEAMDAPIVVATNNTIAFKTDVPVSKTNPFGNGIIDTVKYNLGADITETVNERDKKLYRSVNNGDPFELNYGITNLQFKYFDRSGTELPSSPPDLKSIAVIEYSITLEDVYGYDYSSMDSDTISGTMQGNLFFKAINESKRIALRNLKKR